jgi:choline dehydrogenase-like flavoprotein
VIEDGKAVGVEAESGGKVFKSSRRVVLSAGRSDRPLLMLSGIGPEDHLRQFGIPAVRISPALART